MSMFLGRGRGGNRRRFFCLSDNLDHLTKMWRRFSKIKSYVDCDALKEFAAQHDRKIN